MTVNNLLKDTASDTVTSGNLYSDSTLTWTDDTAQTIGISTIPTYKYSSICTTDDITSMFTQSLDLSASTAFDAIIDVLKEEEIEEILDKLLNRNHDLIGKYNPTVGYIVSKRHVSEKFLKKYWDYLDKYTVMRLHRADILSGEYAEVALLLELND